MERRGKEALLVSDHVAQYCEKHLVLLYMPVVDITQCSKHCAWLLTDSATQSKGREVPVKKRARVSSLSPPSLSGFLL